MDKKKTSDCIASIRKVVDEMRQKAESLIAGIDGLTTNHLGMAIRAERRNQAKELRMFAQEMVDIIDKDWEADSARRR